MRRFVLCAALACTPAMMLGCSSSGVDPYILPGSGQAVDFVDGEYHWTVLDPPRFGEASGSVLVLAPNDVWFFGRDVRHWDGKTVQSTPLTAAGAAGAPVFSHYGKTFVARAPDDIWLAGSALWHYDGAAWTEMTSKISGAKYPPTADEFNRFEVTGDASAMFVLHQAEIPITNPQFTSIKSFEAYSFDGMTFTLSNNLPLKNGSYSTDADDLFTEDGTLGAVGYGIYDSTTQVTTPTLGNNGEIWGRSGKHFYSYMTGTAGLDSPDEGLQLTEAMLPGDFAPTGKIKLADLPKAGSKFVVAFIGPPGQADATGMSEVPEVDVAGIAATSTQATYLVRARDQEGEVAFLVRLENGVASLLADRLHGWEPFSIGLSGDQVFITASGGAILMGSKK